MDEFIAHVADLLRVNFADAVPQLEEALPGERIGGFLITPDFAGVSQIDRQRMLWDVLRNSLEPADQLRLSTILTLTPEEVAAMEEMESMAAA